MSRTAGAIRTPDQRLRVFVSSSLRELVPERRALREAIERLAMAPVMFELGARPHPPRSLYRAYLDQSDIFIGVYWNSYGWVAPGEDVSGLEDEYNLAPDIPKLIYLKRSENRQERLERLLDKIRDDDTVSYVTFDDEEELRALVTADLATLLAEHFDDARHAPQASEETASRARTTMVTPPAPLNRLIGRERELQRCVELLVTQHHRAVTLVGPGGIGKTRLALSVAQAVSASYPDGVVFVDLAPIRDPGVVVGSIAAAMGVRDLGGMPLSERVMEALGQRKILLVLDNVEQVVAAVPKLRSLLEHTAVALLATSRIPLRLQAEQLVSVPPLAVAAAVEMFAERARAVKPDFEITEANEANVARVASALDCVPLAVELAAARVRVLPPAEMAKRVDHALPLLVGGGRDHPDRQQTMRATIQWSADMLSNPERELLLRLGVYRSSFALDAVEWTCDGLAGGSALDLLDGLLDSSLVHEHEGATVPSFTMLAIVREYAREELQRTRQLDAAEQRHADFYVDLARRAEPELVSFGQAEWIGRLNDQFEDLRAAVEYFLRTGQGDAVTDIVWPLYWYWWVSGHTEIRGWMAGVHDSDYEVSERTRHIAQFYRVVGAIWADPNSAGIPELESLLGYFVAEDDTFAEMFIRNSTALLHLQQTPPQTKEADVDLVRAQEIAEERDSPFLVSMALLLRGQVAMVRGDWPGAAELYERSLQTARGGGDAFSQSAALHGLAWVQLAMGDLKAARELFVEHLRISVAMRHEEGLALGLEGMFAVAAMAGDIVRAGRFLGAAEDIRARRGITGPTVFSNHQRILAEVLESPAADEFQAALKVGAEADRTAVLTDALTLEHASASRPPSGQRVAAALGGDAGARYITVDQSPRISGRRKT